MAKNGFLWSEYIITRNTCMQQPLALLQPAMQLYFRNIKYLSIVVIATRQFVFFSVYFFVKIMEKYQF